MSRTEYELKENGSYSQTSYSKSSGKGNSNGRSNSKAPPPPPPPIDSLGEQSKYAHAVLFPSLLKSAIATINSEWILVLSLWIMAVQAAYYFYALYKQKAAVVALLPFALSIFGASFGAVWQSNGFPLIIKKLVQGFRIANVPAVTAAISLMTFAQAYPAASQSTVMAVTAGLVFYTASVSILAMAVGPAPILLLQIVVETALAAVIACFWSPLAHHSVIRGLIALHAGCQLAGFLDVSTGTIFHFLNVAAGYYMFEALQVQPVILTSQWATQITVGYLFVNVLLAVAVVVTVLYLFKPRIYSALRFLFNDVVWQTIYAGLLAMPAWYPQPMREEIYTNNPRVEFVTYGSTHPRATLFEFNGANFIPQAQQLFNMFMVKLIFAVIRFFDTYFPQARTDVPISQKQRVTGSYADYFPEQLAAIVGPATQQRTTVLNWRAKGQLLSYVVSYGHASTMLSRGDRENEVKMDLNFMNKFESKPDFAKYGGVARFRVNRSTSSTASDADFTPLLELVSITPPNSKIEIPVPTNITDPALTDPLSDFRRAEAILLSSSIANCVIAKHCAGIHSYFNLIAVSLHNAFDTQPWLKSASLGNYPHPIRLALMPHFYNHVIVEELTTPHLLERYAVFPQIFNFTDKGLAEYYDRQFSLFDLNSDADITERLSILGLNESSGASLDPVSATLAWEIEYHQVILSYCTKLVEATYQSSSNVNDAVKSDEFIRRLSQELQKALPNGLPKRYGKLDSVATLARFMADTIFCVCIRHHIYGVNSSHYSDDWKSVPNQVPADFGAPAVEDYMSQLYVALATTRPSFILWKPQDEAHRWNYLLAPLAQPVPDIYSSFSSAFDWLQTEFDRLEKKYTANATEQLINFELNRPLPSAICPGSAY